VAGVEPYWALFEIFHLLLHREPLFNWRWRESNPRPEAKPKNVYRCSFFLMFSSGTEGKKHPVFRLILQ
jgi:hypothetical protein